MYDDPQTDTPPDTTVQLSSKQKKLENQKAKIVLPPYSVATDASALLSQDIVLTPDNQDGSPNISETAQTYHERAAENIIFEIAQPTGLQGNSEYAYPINSNEDGELVHFTASFNSDKMRLVCILYDDRYRPTILCNDTPRDLVIKGRGMTLAMAVARDQDGVSLDNHGKSHPVMPYAVRYKDTFSYGFVDPNDYSQVAGTPNDKFYIIEFSPSTPRAYKKIYFNVQNKGSQTRVVHNLIVNRIAYVDRYDYAGGPIQQQPEGGSLGSKLGQKARITF